MIPADRLRLRLETLEALGDAGPLVAGMAAGLRLALADLDAAPPEAGPARENGRDTRSDGRDTHHEAAPPIAHAPKARAPKAPNPNHWLSRLDDAGRKAHALKVANARRAKRGLPPHPEPAAERVDLKVNAPAEPETALAAAMARAVERSAPPEPTPAPEPAPPCPSIADAKLAERHAEAKRKLGEGMEEWQVSAHCRLPLREVMRLKGELREEARKARA